MDHLCAYNEELAVKRRAGVERSDISERRSFPKSRVQQSRLRVRSEHCCSISSKVLFLCSLLANFHLRRPIYPLNTASIPQQHVSSPIVQLHRGQPLVPSLEP